MTPTLSEGSNAGTGEGADVEISADEVSLDDDDEDALPPEGGGSGRCSRFVALQRGHVQSRDLGTVVSH